VLRKLSCQIFRLVAVWTIVVLMVLPALAQSAKVIYSFAGDEDGEYPDTDLVLDGAGNIYGTTVGGGTFGSGTVFMLSPNGSGWTHTVLYSFTSGSDGGQPYKGVALGPQGELYGATVTGGTGSGCEGGCGVVYQLVQSGGTWTETVVHNFSGGLDGSGPGNGLTVDQSGNLYGMTPTGGAQGLGTIYQLHPTSGGFSFKVLHAFTGGTDGAAASAGRLLLAHHAVFGVATVGGAHGAGTAFKLAQAQGLWTFASIYAFQGEPNAGFPYSALVLDSHNDLYGTTYYSGASDLGSVYELSSSSGTGWTESLLYSFGTGGDANSPIGNLVLDQSNDLYGTASGGGTANVGAIFKLTRIGNGQWSESIAYNFKGTPDGALPYNGMVADSAGNYYGATVSGGSSNEGAIYQFTP
jgi:uncharacterized repeat protein (TIGR03803 family)